MKISTLSPAAIPTFLIRAQNDSGVRWLGGVFIKSRTIWVFSAITLALLIAALASALLQHQRRRLDLAWDADLGTYIDQAIP